MTASSPNNSPLSNTDQLLQIAALAALGIHGVIIALYYPGLPDRIPIHFGIDGTPDGWGEKWVLLLLLGITVGMYALLRFITTIGPDKYTYSTPLTPQNRGKQFQLSRQLIFMINAGTMILFLIISWAIIQTAKGNWNGLGSWFWVVLVVLIFVPIGYTLVVSQKYK